MLPLEYYYIAVIQAKSMPSLLIFLHALALQIANPQQDEGK